MFRVYVLRILWVLAVFRRSVLRMPPDLQHFGVRFCGYSLCLKYFGVLYCGYCYGSGSISSVGTARTASTRSTKILSVCAVYSEYEVLVLGPFVHRVDKVIPLFLQKTFTDGPTSGSKLLSVGATGVLESTGCISGLYTANTRSFSRVYTRSFSRVCSADTCTSNS